MLRSTNANLSSSGVALRRILFLSTSSIPSGPAVRSVQRGKMSAGPSAPALLQAFNRLGFLPSVLPEAICRPYSSAATSEAELKLVRKVEHSFSAEPGLTLKVRAAGATNVEVSKSPSENNANVEVVWFNESATEKSADQYVSFYSDDTAIAVDSCTDKEGTSPDEALNADIIKCEIPEKQFNVDVHTWEGNATIENVEEGNLHVVTKGGDVNLGKITGLEAVIDTFGGNLTAKSIYARLVARTRGGNAEIERAMGSKIDLEIGDGTLQAGSIYGNEFFAKCSKFSANNVRTDNGKVFTVNGGDVTIGGVDGSLSVFSGGGDVEVQLQGDCRKLEVDSKEGDVTIYFPNAHTTMVEYSGAGFVDIQVPHNLVAKTPSKMLSPNNKGVTHHVFTIRGLGDPSAGPRRSLANLMDAASEDSAEGSGVGLRLCSVVVNSTTGNLTMKRRTWAEALAGLK